MMNFAFDLISDLHVDNWDDFNWTHQATSPYCVVAGDVARNRELLVKTLKHLGNCYAAVFYIDGNEEHREYYNDIGASYRAMDDELANIKNVVYMQDNVVIINGVAILSTNGWWSYDFDVGVDAEKTQEWFENYVEIPEGRGADITSIGYHDAAYLLNSVSRLQKEPDVKSIVIVTHTLPAPWLAQHDIDLADTWRFNCLGNRHLQLALDEDTENKIKAWCFGHYHKPVDRDFGGIRYVSNPHGRKNTPWVQKPYYPKRIEIKI